MYRKDYFYGLTDLMHHNVYAALLKDKIKKEERVIIKVFKKDDEVVVIETNNFHDEILKDTRKNKETDLMTFDLPFVKVLERYYCDYECSGMIYEYVDGIGAWYRVKIDGYDPLDKRLRPFYLKKSIKLEDLKKYTDNQEELLYLENFYKLTKGLLKFTKPQKVRQFFDEFLQNL